MEGSVYDKDMKEIIVGMFWRLIWKNTLCRLAYRYKHIN